MKWATALSEKTSFDSALAEVAASVREQLGGEPPHLVLAFAAPLLAAAVDLPQKVHALWPDALLIGCSGAGVIGAGREVEQRPALALVAASLPGVTLTPFHLDALQLPQDASPQAWRTVLGVPGEPSPSFLVIADPFTCDVESLVTGLDRAYPTSCKFGGLASGGRAAGAHRLFLGLETWRSGAIGVAMSGALTVETLVAQGCRPLGPPMLVTRCDDHLLLELGGRPPLEVLREMLGKLSDEERTEAPSSLFVGIERKKTAVEFHEGELLVRSLVGIEPKTGALAVGAHLEPYQVLQFMTRDAAAATEDLSALLKRYRASHGERRPAGALLFSCVGRGESLFGKPDHDSTLFRELVGPVPLGGFFCNGEIGPVGGATFLHGQTSSFALFSPLG